MSTLRGFLDVKPEERRNTFAAFATLLLITTGHTLLETARDALFLSKLPAAQLPWMYLVIVVLALGLSQIRRADSKGAIVSVLAVAAGVTAGFWGLASVPRPWVLYALYVWSGLFASWVMVQFWTLLGRAHTMTQAKRLYGVIGAGAVLGAVVGAFAARAALSFVPPRAILLASAALFLLAALPVLGIRLPEEPTELTVDSKSASTSSMTTAASLLWENAFARRILGIVLVATISVTLTDFLFKARIAQAFANDAGALASWLSTFYAVTNTISLVAQLFIGPWIFRAVGVQRALFFFPTLLLGAATGVLATFGLLASAVLLKAIDGTVRYSVHKTSMELLLVPIPDGTRERIKPIIELVGSRGGQAVASLVILALVGIGAANTLTIAAFIVALTVLWIAIVVTIRGHYLDVFRETLRSGGLSGKAELPELDLGALEMLFAGLSSSRDLEVLASLELLAEQHRERLIPALILYHPSREVVLRALELFIQRGRVDFVSIADRLNGHPDRDVAAAALRARTAVAPDRKLLEERLADRCPQVAATALIALMARSWIDPDEADRRVREVIGSRYWRAAAELARAIRDLASDPRSETKDVTLRFDELLIRLAREAGSFREYDALSRADDGGTPRPPGGFGPELWGAVELAPDIRVRLEVAKAMAARKQPAFLPILVGMLNRHELRPTARAAIAPIPRALDFLDEVMSHHDFARDVRVHLPRTMVLFEPEAAARKLMSHLVTEKDGAVRFKVLRALVKLRRAHPKLTFEEDELRKVVESTLDHAAELRQWGRGLAGTDEEPPPTSATGGDPLRAAHHLLLDLVRDKESHATQRLFMLLELLYADDFESIERGLRSKKPKRRASSLELVENIVRPPLRARVLALVGDGEEVHALSYEDTIRTILVKGSTTMRTLAEYRAVEIGIDIGARPSQAPTIESLGKRLVDRARDLLTPEKEREVSQRGASRAPA